jgi:Fe-S cluster assembly protein SufD
MVIEMQTGEKTFTEKIPTTLPEQEQLAFEFFERECARILKNTPDWFRPAREFAANTHLLLGIPTHKHEEWRFTSLRGLLSHAYQPSRSFRVSKEQVASFFFGSVKGPRLVVVNGFFDEELSTSYKDLPGLQCSSLKEAFQKSPELLEKHLSKIADTHNYTFGALNTALFEDGVFLQLGRNVQPESPIQILYLSIPTEHPTCHHPRNLFLLDEGSNAHIVEIYASLGEGVTFNNVLTEAFVGQGAILEHIKIQRESTAAYHIALTQIKQARDSRLVSDSITFGGALTRNDLNLWLDGEGIDSVFNGLYVIHGEQIADNHTRIDHAKPHCHSYELYKGVLDDRAHGVFNGKIYVHQDAQKTDAKQSNQALLLSKTASVNSKPQLEIFADDVKCTHGATVGQLNKDPLFYVRSRGIPQKEAEALLVYAFASEVIEKISLPEVRDSLEAFLYDKLHGKTQ